MPKINVTVIIIVVVVVIISIIIIITIQTYLEICFDYVPALDIVILANSRHHHHRH